MITIDDPRIAVFLDVWHENGRPFFERSYSNLDYDSEPYVKTAKNRNKYIALDEGTSGRFLLDKATGLVWGIKAYGVRHSGKLAGHIDELIETYRAINAENMRLIAIAKTVNKTHD